jgi:MFS family permease
MNHLSAAGLDPSATAADVATVAARGARWASQATMLLSITTVLGCLFVAPLANRLGRRGALAIFFAIMAISIFMVFGWTQVNGMSLPWMVFWLAMLGVGGASFGVYTLWLPEQYPTECRASAFALATSIGRFGGAGITFLVGMGVARFHGIGIPVALTSVAFLVGLALVPFGEETKGRPLPN